MKTRQGGRHRLGKGVKRKARPGLWGGKHHSTSEEQEDSQDGWGRKWHQVTRGWVGAKSTGVLSMAGKEVEFCSKCFWKGNTWVAFSVWKWRDLISVSQTSLPLWVRRDCGGAGGGSREIPGDDCRRARSDDGDFDERDSNGDGMRWMALRCMVQTEPPDSLRDERRQSTPWAPGWVATRHLSLGRRQESGWRAEAN